MDRNKRKSETLTCATAASSSRRRCEEEHVDEWRDWASLARDVLRIVLSQLLQTDILRGAGLVCSHWRRFAMREALLWRHIDLSGGRLWWRRPELPPAGWKSMVCTAVDRSAGRCESFIGHVDADVLIHLANRAPLLRNLHVAEWHYIPDKDLITGIITKLPLLERFMIWSGLFQQELLVALLDHCPRLELLNVHYVDPTFMEWEEPIAARIWRSTIKHLLMPNTVLE